jgi:hypothetical protein
VVVLSVVAVLLLLWGLYIVVTHMRDSAAQEDFGPEFAAYLKIVALITIAALALLGLLFVTGSARPQLSALFALLGTIAGYIAAKQPSGGGDGDSVVPDGTPGGPGPGVPPQPNQNPPVPSGDQASKEAAEKAAREAAEKAAREAAEEAVRVEAEKAAQAAAMTAALEQAGQDPQVAGEQIAQAVNQAAKEAAERVAPQAAHDAAKLAAEQVATEMAQGQVSPVEPVTYTVTGKYLNSLTRRNRRSLL